MNAAAPPGAASAKIQWRFAPTTEGDTTTGWTDATEVKKATDGSAWSGSVSGTDLSTTPRLIWDPRAESGISAPALVEVRVAFSYPGSVTKVSPLQRVQVVPHAFGGSFPTEDFGPGQAALFTGEFQLSEDDVDVPGYGESLTLGRSHLTMAAEPAGPAGVFGPGWTADLSGPEEGAAGFRVTDRTGTDGTFQLISPEGESYVYLHSSKTRGAQQVGTYNGVGETALDDDTLKLAAVTGETGITHRLTLTEWDGTKTIFVRGTTGVWTIEKVVSLEDNSTTTYAHNTDGTVSWIFAPAPAGVACDTSSQEPGCRALQLVYTGTGADKRLTEVKLRIWDPKPGTDGKPGSTSGMNTISVAKYTYNGSGQLTAMWDPRVADGASALKTEYEYATIDGKTKITKITEPGLKPWRFEYTDGGKIYKVLRAQDAAAGSGDAVWTVKYDLALAGNGDGLPNLSADATSTWGQDRTAAPTGGTAVFGPDQVPDSTPTAAQYEYADLSYFTQAGRTTNTASYGAGAWQVDSTRYDTLGNKTWSLDAEGRSKALAEGNTTAETAGAADKYATLTVYNTGGTRVEETYDPMREMLLDDGTPVVGRTVTQTVYDDEADASLMPGRPTTDVPAGGFGLAVEERTSVTDRTSPGADGNLFDTKKTRYRYDPVSAGDGDGWQLKIPTRGLTQDGSGWSTTLTRFDTEGKIIETRTPQGTETTDGPGLDTRSTNTVYYTADTSASRSECRSKPAWAGEVCWTGPAGQPGSGQPIPATSTTGYSIMLSPTRVEEASGAVTRVDISEFDPAGRTTTSSTTTSGLAKADRAVPATTTTYSPTTGAVTAVSNGTQTQTTGYDSWGRTTSRTDGAGNTATTTYDAAGRVATANDGKGTYNYTYNGTDSRGKAERRGLVTSLDVGLASGPDVFTGAYDASGDLIEQNYPGGIKATWTKDVTGDDLALTYEQGGGPLLAYSSKVDADGRVRETTGTGSTQSYTYDDRERLTKVQDTIDGACTTRTYGFSGDSNRTSLNSYDPVTGGACQNSTSSSSVTSAFDAADRITTTGYSYDELGRTNTVPAAHTSNSAGGGALSVEYHTNDMVATLSQPVTEDGVTATKAQDFTLDAAGRLSVTKNLTGGVSLTESTNHYDGSGDSLVWIETRTRPDAATTWGAAWGRNVASLAGDLGIIAGSDGTAKIQLPNMHSDIAATVAVGGTGIDSYTEYTEYGLARDNANTPERYGWLGTKQRDANTIGGLTLMGARLYNPTTATFLSRDPVAGGNDNTYTYPVDPINMFDLSGEWGWSKKKWRGFSRGVGKWAGRGSSALGWCPLAQCQAASLALGGVSAAGYALGGRGRKARAAMRGMAFNALTGGRGKWSGLIRGSGRKASRVRRAVTSFEGRGQGGLYGRAWRVSGHARGARHAFRASTVTIWYGHNAWNSGVYGRR
ncbi:RHS repeat-associated core domain-containing protein [Aeromicrobium sp.]|uniref:RHS repeat-associated core domain-containing protein n=1 Tax=Aeromicrobium sp. TaxID=1871063 RepID=UPI0025BF0747|nr:RHS repeat-associated core domain-containing protein [Aeromicrobium sp.]